jgi:predicted  nucleic acid-binding Zn-ribbon protein
MTRDYKDLYKKVQQELGEEREKNMRLTVECNDFKAQLSDKSADIERLQKNLQLNEARLKKILNENHLRSSGEVSSFEKFHEDSDIDTLDKDLGGDISNTHEMDEKYQKLKQENEQLKKQIRDRENSILNELENELMKKDSSLQTSQEDMVRIQKRLALFEKQNKDLKAEIDRLKNEEYGYLELQNEYKILKSEKKATKDKISKLQTKLKSLEEAKLELEKLKKTFSDLEEEKKELKLEIKETRALLEKHKDENYELKTKIIEKEKELKYSNIMKLELEALKTGTKQEVTSATLNLENEKIITDKENQILHLKLDLKTKESELKDKEHQFTQNLKELERDFNEKESELKEQISQLQLDKDDIEGDMKEQEKLMMSAMASFYFDTLNNQQMQKQKDQKKGGEISFLKKLRNASYGVGY